VFGPRSGAHSERPGSHAGHGPWSEAHWAFWETVGHMCSPWGQDGVKMGPYDSNGPK